MDFLRTISKGYQGQIRNILMKFMAPSYTTTEITNLPNPQAGMIVFNETTAKHQGYDGTTWNNLY